MSIDCVLNRRSVRSYTSEPISEDDLRTLLKAGMYAPSAVNRKPWEFVVITDEAMRRSISEVCEYWRPAAAAPLVVVVCGDTRSGEQFITNYFVQDCACASENILVAAAGLGLGGVWLGVYGEEPRMLGVSDLLEIPEGVYPVSVLAIGHPQNVPAPHTGYDENKVHIGKF